MSTKVVKQQKNWFAWQHSVIEAMLKEGGGSVAVSPSYGHHKNRYFASNITNLLRQPLGFRLPYISIPTALQRAFTSLQTRVPNSYFRLLLSFAVCTDVDCAVLNTTDGG